MDSRLIRAGSIFFLVAYAQTTPLFSLFSVKPNIALALSVILAFSYGTFYECAILVVLGTVGLMYGTGLPYAFFFFSAVFVLARGVASAVPWQPFVSGLALVLFFSFLTYASPDWHLLRRLALPFAREAFFNAVVFTALYALFPPRYVPKRRY